MAMNHLKFLKSTGLGFQALQHLVREVLPYHFALQILSTVLRRATIFSQSTWKKWKRFGQSTLEFLEKSRFRSQETEVWE